jgi:hypothetical protein
MKCHLDLNPHPRIWVDPLQTCSSAMLTLLFSVNLSRMCLAELGINPRPQQMQGKHGTHCGGFSGGRNRVSSPWETDWKLPSMEGSSVTSSAHEEWKG